MLGLIYVKVLALADVCKFYDKNVWAYVNKKRHAAFFLLRAFMCDELLTYFTMPMLSRVWSLLGHLAMRRFASLMVTGIVVP